MCCLAPREQCVEHGGRGLQGQWQGQGADQAGQGQKERVVAVDVDRVVRPGPVLSALAYAAGTVPTEPGVVVTGIGPRPTGPGAPSGVDQGHRLVVVGFKVPARHEQGGDPVAYGGAELLGRP